MTTSPNPVGWRSRGGIGKANLRSRSTIVVAIGVMHACVLVVLTSHQNPVSRRSSTDEPAPMLLTFFDEPVKESAALETGPSAARTVGPVAERRVDAAAAGSSQLTPSPSADTSISTAPLPPDWGAEAERAAREELSREQQQDSLRSLAGHPKGMDLPPPRHRPHQLGDTEHFEGGEIIDWINDRCYYSNRDPTGLPWQPGQLMMPVCKPRAFR